MKKCLFTIAAVSLMTISLSSCRQDSPEEELEEMEVLATEHGESTNSNGGQNEDPDNGEG